MGGVRVERERVVQALDLGEPVGDELIGAVLDPLGGGGVGRAAVGRVVLEAAILRRIVRGRNDDAVALRLAFVRGVVGEDGVRERGRGRVGELVVDHDVDAIRREHLERGGKGRLGERVRVLRQEERAGDGLAAAIVDDGLGDGGDVVVVE